MSPTIGNCALAGLLAVCAATALAQPPDYVPGGAASCLACHDFGADSPVHAMFQGSHGATDSTETPMGRAGCEECHGPSAAHASAPTQVSPAVSYGPRWSATAAAQDGFCLDCHRQNSARHWQDALHMLNNLTCVTCHDIHQDADKVMLAAGQADVCTVCHKAQKAGLHGLESQLADNPPCSSCHNPHDGESALGTMLDNDSAGCRSCHDLVAMAADPAASVKADNYHLVMAQADRTCLDCHQGIAHGPATAVAAFVPQASNTRTVALFYPAQSTSQWLQTRHPGSQALRQGRNCQQCHRGEEPHMATVLADDIRPALRQIQVSFSRDEEDLQVMLRWPGAASDASISLMWGDDAGSAAFRRGGCFAACHDDMTGMGRDRGQKTAKYLAVSRARLQGIGQPAQRRPGAELTALVEQGNVVEFWQINLNGGQASATAAALLAEPIRDHSSRLSASASHEQGIWTVSVRRPLAAGLKPFRADAKYTLGIALNGAANPGGRHWVSMPMTLSLGGDDTDFRVD